MATSAMKFELLTMARLRLAHNVGCYHGHAMLFCLEYSGISGICDGLIARAGGFPVFAQGCSVPISRGSPPTFILDE